VSTPEGIAPSRPQRPKPALRAELLFYLTFLAAFALLVGVATSLLALAMAPERGVAAIVILIALEVASSCCTVARS
jgi:cytochrome c biogenesis factor